MTFSREHGAWNAGKDRWYKAVGWNGGFRVFWYSQPPVGSVDLEHSNMTNDALYTTREEAEAEARGMAENWRKNNS